MQDPYLPQIVGLVAAGLTATAFSVSGYLHQSENFQLLGARLEYQAAYRKIPLSVLGTGLCISAWLLTQQRREYVKQYQLWERQQLMLGQQQQAIAHQAHLEGYSQLAQLQAAERLYPHMAPYLDVPYRELPQEPLAAPSPPSPTPDSVAPSPTAAVPTQSPITPASASAADETAYLCNFLEYPGLLFGGMGAGKSWTTRYLVMQKVRAGHQVVVLDPHAANHEWKGIRHIGAGMDYRAIADFLAWYLDEIERRYQEFNRSGLSEEDWQQTLRQQGRILSVVCEEMTNWADRLSGEIGSRFFKAAMSDSRKVLLPPLFVAHDRTLSALGDAKGVARLRDAALLELELMATIHPVTRKPVSSGKGKLKLPGHSEWVDVVLPTIERKLTDFTPWVATPSTSVADSSTTSAAASSQSNTTPDFRTQVLNWLEDCWQTEASAASLSPSDPIDQLPDGHLKQLALYLRKKQQLAVRDVKRNWGGNVGLNGSQVDALLIELMTLNLVITYSPDSSRAEWVRWIGT